MTRVGRQGWMKPAGVGRRKRGGLCHGMPLYGEPGSKVPRGPSGRKARTRFADLFWLHLSPRLTRPALP